MYGEPGSLGILLSLIYIGFDHWLVPALHVLSCMHRHFSLRLCSCLILHQPDLCHLIQKYFIFSPKEMQTHALNSYTHSLNMSLCELECLCSSLQRSPMQEKKNSSTSTGLKQHRNSPIIRHSALIHLSDLKS